LCDFIYNRVIDIRVIMDNQKRFVMAYVQGGSNMAGTDLYVNKPHCAAAVRP